MTREDRERRIVLMVLSSFFVFCIIVITSVITVILVNIMVSVDIIAEVGGRVKLTPVLLITSFISMVVGVAVTAFTSMLPLRPVNTFLDQMNRLAGGDFSARIYFEKPNWTHSTFVEIYKSFNKMAEELENTALLRNDFINNFSHEFKTPIVSIAGFAKLLRRGNLSEEQRQEYLTVIEEEALRLSYMATNETILTDVTEYNLSEQIRGCILLLENKWTQKGLHFQVEVGEHQVQASEELLKQVWINLIDNAVKYAREDSTIRVSVQKKGDQVEISVTDRGEPIQPEKLAKIFHKFYQADESHSSEGNGIGLAIVKRVVDLHNGKVSARCDGMEVVFTVLLPRKQ